MKEELPSQNLPIKKPLNKKLLLILSIIFTCFSMLCFCITCAIGIALYSSRTDSQTDRLNQDSSSNPTTNPTSDFSGEKYFYLYGSEKNKISFYYPTTHVPSESKYGITINVEDFSLDPQYSLMKVEIIDLEFLKKDKPTNAIDSSADDLFNNFKSYTSSKSLYKDQVKIHGKDYKVSSYSSAEYDSESSFIDDCDDRLKEHYDVVDLNYKFSTVITYYSGKICDEKSQKPTKLLSLSQRDFDLSYKILDSMKFSDNNSEIQKFKELQSVDSLRKRINQLKDENDIEIYFDEIPDSLDSTISRYAKYRELGELDSEIEKTYYLLNGMEKYPKGFFKKAGINNIVLTQYIRDDGHEIAGYAFNDTNTIFIAYDVLELSEISAAFDHELMHIMDYDRKNYSLVNKSLDKWDEINTLNFNYFTETECEEDRFLCATNNYSPEGFPSGYGMTSIYEDRAEVFRMLTSSKERKYIDLKKKTDKKFTEKVDYLQSYIISRYPELSEMWFREINYL